MRRTILLVAALLPCTALAQPADYRITEFTQACERWDMVHGSVENATAKRGVGAFGIGCKPVAEGREVRLIQRKGDLAPTRSHLCYPILAWAEAGQGYRKDAHSRC